MLVLIIPIVISIVGAVCGIWGLIYVYRQTKMMRRQLELMERDILERREREAEDDRSAYRFEQLSTKLLRINPNLQVLEPGQKNATWIYSTMFADGKLINAVQTFIVAVHPSGTTFLPRKPQPHEFRSPGMRDTIQKAEAAMDRFLEEHPFCKQHLVG